MKWATPIALAAATLVATGCSSSAPSDASFAAKADAICVSVGTGTGTGTGSGSGSGGLTASTGVAAVNSEEARVSTELTRLQGVSAPLDVAPAFQAYQFQLGTVQSLLRRLAVAVAAHEHAKIESIESQLGESRSDGRTSALQAGLKHCE